MYTTPENFPLLLLAGLGTGVLGAMLGTGGGVFLIPILVLGLDVPMHYAIATSIVSVVATSTAVASVNVERGTANMRLGMTLEMATALGAIVGGLSVAWLPERTLEALFAIVLLPTAIMMWRGKKGEGEELLGEDAQRESRGARHDVADATPEQRRLFAIGELGGEYYDARLGRDVYYRVERLWGGMLISLMAGVMSGMLGVGGGVFKVPAMHLVCGVPIKVAAATSNFMIGVTAAASAFLYFGRGEVRPALTATVVLGVLAGSAIGLVVNRFVHGRVVKQLFAALLVAVALQMLFRVWSG